MQVRQLATSSRRFVAKAADGLTRLAKLERVLAAWCALLPFALVSCDEGPVRESISAYYSMEQAQAFYVPLTVAAMLFVVNGVVKRKRAYNWMLGVALAGVIVLNHDDFPRLHTACAAAFFVGNAVVMVWFSPRKELWFKGLLVAGIAAAMAACFVLQLFSLFVAEWLSFGIIALHYILESWGYIE
jgi:hypothetical protein